MKTIIKGVQGYTDGELQQMSCEEIHREICRVVLEVYRDMDPPYASNKFGYKVQNYENHLNDVITEQCPGDSCEYCSVPH